MPAAAKADFCQIVIQYRTKKKTKTETFTGAPHSLFMCAIRRRLGTLVLLLGIKKVEERHLRGRYTYL